MIVNLRREPRDKERQPVSFGCSSNGYWAMSADVSKHGVRLYTNRPIEPGKTYELQSNFIWRTEQKAHARWSKRVGREIYMAGFTLLTDAG